MLSDRRAHTTLPVQDLSAARAFWEGRLGFRPVQVLPSAVLYGAGAGSVFAVSKASARSTGAHTQMAFSVDDVDAEVAAMAAHGIVFEAYDLPTLRTVDGVAEMPGGVRAAWFKDQDGNLIGIVELPA